MNKVDQYIEKHAKWRETLHQIRSILLKTELTETIKWGTPTYTFNNANIVAMGAFKKHVALWFFQGVFMKDPYGLLQNAQEGKTKAMRQIRIEADDQILEKELLLYLKEAIENEKAGIRLCPQKDIAYEIPELLKEALEDPQFNTAFFGLTSGKQKDYANYISEARRTATKASRMKKIRPMIIDGIGLYDHYKKC
tara:strand:+ start:352 stop:936 length:585 start_codon:yes stop_codon:yes gene_type:complete